MKPDSRSSTSQARWLSASVGLGLCFAAAFASSAEDKTVFKCPGNLYTDALSAKEAAAKGCKTLEGQPITVIQAFKVPAGSAGKSEERIEAPSRARQSDTRRILEDELRKAEEELATMKTEYADGQPERQGDEKNYQKYTDRVAQMKAAITRKEADIEALKREVSKLPRE